MNYGIELEFFVFNKDEKLVPAYLVTSNIDGFPVTGEIRTGVHSNITDCVFELKKLLYLEEQAIESKGYKLKLIPEIKVDSEFIKALRKDPKYVNSKHTGVLEELSIYLNGKVGKVLPQGLYKASLQVNLSLNKNFDYTEYTKVSVEDKYRYDSKVVEKSYASLFDYITPLNKMDKAFADDLQKSGRVKGVFAIKSGILGDRIEYRSLPNNINIERLIEILK